MKRNRLLNERNLFWLLSFLSLLPVCFTQYIGSLDGPQHLYGSNIIAQLVKGNQEYANYFVLNPPFVGNILGNYILGLFNLFLPAWVAEKALIISYLLGFYAGFRYLVISIKGKAGYFTLLIFPFAYHALFMLGYYNFSIGIALMFFVVGFWVRIMDQWTWKKLITLFLLFILLYYTHVVVFAAMLFIVGFHTFFIFLSELMIDKRKAFSVFGQRTLILLLCALPGLVMTWYYLGMLPDTGSGGAYLAFDYWHYISHLKFMVGFDHHAEDKFLRPLFILLSLMFGGMIVKRIIEHFSSSTEAKKSLFQLNDTWLLMALLFLVLYLFLPKMMSIPQRMAVIFACFVLLWLALQDVKPWLAAIPVALVIYLFISVQSIHVKEYKGSDRVIKSVKSLGSFIPDNSVILTLNYSSNWLFYHFENYIGTDIPVIDFSSPAISPLFVVNWKPERPFAFIGAKNAALLLDFANTQYAQQNAIAQYIIVMGYNEYLNMDEKDKFKSLINRDYKLVHVAEGNVAALYSYSAGGSVEKVKSYLLSSPGHQKLMQEKADLYNVPFETILMRDALWTYDQSFE